MEQLIENLLDALVDVVDYSGMPWKDKKNLVLKAARTEHELMCLEEFCSWFEGEK